jgi:hypothetical protein
LQNVRIFLAEATRCRATGGTRVITGGDDPDRERDDDCAKDKKPHYETQKKYSRLNRLRNESVHYQKKDQSLEQT